MLTPLDDTLRHVLATTFDHAGTSDPRFFDRYWFAIYDPAGTDLAINTGMCSYLNMNVIDGYAAVIRNGTPAQRPRRRRAAAPAVRVAGRGHLGRTAAAPR